MASIQDLMNLIGRMEGWGISNSVATRNNNPGNLKYAGQVGAIDRDSKGYAIFTSPDAGMNALQRQIELDASRDLSIREFINKYAPSSENNTSGYLAFVTEGLGVGADDSLKSVVYNQRDYIDGFDNTSGINLGSYGLEYNTNLGASLSSMLDGNTLPIFVLGIVALGFVMYES